jgi:hypothetical protein
MLRLYDSAMARLSVGSGQQQRETAILGLTMARYADPAADSMESGRQRVNLRLVRRGARRSTMANLQVVGQRSRLGYHRCG